MNIYILFGQTATGKTAKAFELVKQCDGEIVNFDSRQIYKKLDIITGKDRPDDPTVNIWLYDEVDPKKSFSSAEYCARAMTVLTDIIARGKTPILVGGTGYYLVHLLYGVPEVRVLENNKVRTELNKKTVAELQTLLQEKNESMFTALNESDRANPRRLIRRIEIAMSGGILPAKPQQEILSLQFAATLNLQPFFHATQEIAREKIALRVDQRIQNGALDEVRHLHREGYTENDPGLNAIGYRQLLLHLRGVITLDEAKNDWITKEVQYAKRQKTFFKKMFSSLIK
jgi:tRNA dimethylallyltransferase